MIASGRQCPESAICRSQGGGTYFYPACRRCLHQPGLATRGLRILGEGSEALSAMRCTCLLPGLLFRSFRRAPRTGRHRTVVKITQFGRSRKIPYAPSLSGY